MAASETRELLQRAQRLIEESAHGNDRARAEFGQALNRLRQLGGRPPLEGYGLEFEHDVSEALVRLRDVVVSLPRIDRPDFGRPDFVVQRGDRIVLVEAIATRFFSISRARRRAGRLATALPHYGASRAFIVVPDNPNNRGDADELAPSVELVQLSRLAFAVDRALGGSP